MQNIEKYESDLIDRLSDICRQKNLFDGVTPSSPDILERWESISIDYSADAIHEFNGYPVVVLAWAAYIGSAVAFWWDKDWNRYRSYGYDQLKGARGFDDLDEHVTRDILGLPLNSAKASELSRNLAFLAEESYSFMLHQPVERQSVESFNIFRMTLSAMYRIGAAIELNALGYKMEAI